jgi:transcriptional regulator GlxA family with amidase domain
MFAEVALSECSMIGKRIPHACIARSLRYMTQNFHRPITVADLVKRSGLSPRGYMKAFQRHAGVPPGKLLRRLRIEWAKGMLIERKATLAELTEACGFRRLNSFEVTFRREVGMSPMQYRRAKVNFTVSQTFGDVDFGMMGRGLEA